MTKEQYLSILWASVFCLEVNLTIIGVVAVYWVLGGVSAAIAGCLSLIFPATAFVMHLQLHRDVLKAFEGTGDTR